MKSVLLIDLSSIIHPMFHMSASEPDPNWTSTQVVARVRALASGQPHVAVCCDKGPYFRKQLDPEYKANRPAADAPLMHQADIAIETLKVDGFPVWAVKGFEADDLIASATVETLDDMKAGGGTVTIVSADKDLLQLVNERVCIKSLRDGSILDAAAVREKFGVDPHQVRDYLSMVGDVSDNVKGAKGVGAVTAAKLLQTFGNLDDLYAAIDKGDANLKPALAASLTEFRTRANTVRELIALRTDVPLPIEEIWTERVPANTEVFGEPESASEPIMASGPMDVPLPLSAPKPAEPATEPARNATFSVAPVESYKEYKVASTGRLEPSQSLVARDVDIPAPAPSEFERQLEPRSMAQAKQLALDMFQSRLFSAYGNAPAVLATVLAGRELGLQAMASLRGFHVIENKPALSADLIRALVLKSGAAEYFRCTARSAEAATFITKRKGEPEMSLTYTIAEGRAAFAGNDQSWKASGWAKNPADMCVARAGSKLARLVYPDVVAGLYSPEELS